MKNSCFLFCLLLLFSIDTSAQSSKQTAAANIRQLKNGALFVRLKTSENMINALLMQNNKQGAEALRLEQEKKNMEIVSAFRENFNFCTVYFFYSNASVNIQQGNHKGFLYNNMFEKDTSFTGNDYLIGEFGESETGKIDGFIFKDKNSKQLRGPFPFLIRQNKGGVAERSKAEMAALISKELDAFYKSVITKNE